MENQTSYPIPKNLPKAEIINLPIKDLFNDNQLKQVETFIWKYSNIKQFYIGLSGWSLLYIRRWF